MTDVFVSYARVDQPFVLEMITRLRNHGVDVWIDQQNIDAGDEWDSAVEKALKASRKVIVVLSPAARESNNVKDEISYSLEKKKRIIPIMYKKCDPPIRLLRKQRIDFTKKKEDGYHQLLCALGAVTGPKEQVDVWFNQGWANLLMTVRATPITQLRRLSPDKWDFLGMMILRSPVAVSAALSLLGTLIISVAVIFSVSLEVVLQSPSVLFIIAAGIFAFVFVSNWVGTFFVEKHMKREARKEFFGH